MYKGELMLTGGNDDVINNNGVMSRHLNLIAYGKTPEEVSGKVSKALDNITMTAGPDCCDAYKRDVSEVPALVRSKLNYPSFSFKLNYDDWEDIVAGASWKIELATGTTIVLQ